MSHASTSIVEAVNDEGVPMARAAGSANAAESATRAVDRVFDWVLHRILTGEYLGGEPLRIRQLAAEAGTSVMPVREALNRLQEVGLASSAPHRGTVVKTFTSTELLQAYEVRALLERQAAFDGAANVDQKRVTLMWDALERMEEAVQRDDISQALDNDEEIHRLAYQASGNDVLVDTINALWLRCRPYKFLGVTRDHEHGDTHVWETQRGFIEAVAEGNVHSASGIIADSLENARRRIVETLENERATP
ncbi:MAG: GntR family transcriptional regulator [Canibacter sp.]